MKKKSLDLFTSSVERLSVYFLDAFQKVQLSANCEEEEDNTLLLYEWKDQSTLLVKASSTKTANCPKISHEKASDTRYSGKKLKESNLTR